MKPFMNSDPALVFQWKTRICQIDKDCWNSLALNLKTPFFEWDWLNILEKSESIVEQHGWHPHHLTLWEGNRLVAAAPLYVKEHSEGEFVFDHVWAEVSHRLGASFYPKLIGMSPVTPTTGYRFLIAPDMDEIVITGLMLEEIEKFCLKNRLSGVNFLFVDPQWGKMVIPKNYHAWVHQSYAWRNRQFGKFSDFLGVFNTNQRRNIKREQASLKHTGTGFKAFSGVDIPVEFFPVMYRFYCLTNAKFGPWSCKYLNENFFLLLDQHFRERLVFMAAFDGSGKTPLGMSMLVNKGDNLYGRYWGCSTSVDYLHFSTCYYEPIKWAIENGIEYYDPGIGGMHKTRRGFIAVPNYSLHRFFNPRLMQIMSANIDHINLLENEEITRLNALIPFSESGRRLMGLKPVNSESGFSL